MAEAQGPGTWRLARRLAARRQLEHFEDEDVQMSVAANVALLDSYDLSIAELELFLEHRAKVHLPAPDGPTLRP